MKLSLSGGYPHYIRMENLPEVLKRIIEEYMRPSGILSQYPIAMQELLINDTEEAWKFWTRHAQGALNIASGAFEQTRLTPYERYLQLYTVSGRVDYGSERYADKRFSMYVAIHEGNIPLMDYLLSKAEKCRSLEHKRMRQDGCVLDGFAVASAPNFHEVISFLEERGMRKHDIATAWVGHFLDTGDYKSAVNLIHNDTYAGSCNLLHKAIRYAIVRKNLPIVRRLLQDFNVIRKDRYLLYAVKTNDPEMVYVIANAFHKGEEGLRERILEHANIHRKMRVYDYFK